MPASTALETLTMLDLTRVRAGPTCVRQFADWGAKVIKIEMPEEGGASTQTDFSARHEADFQNLHRNKRGMTLNLKTAQGLDVLRRMVAQADIVVENYRPDVKHRERFERGGCWHRTNAPSSVAICRAGSILIRQST